MRFRAGMQIFGNFLRRFHSTPPSVLFRTLSFRHFCNSVVDTGKSPPFSIPQSRMKTNLFTYRTHTCGELCLNDVGKRVTLCGWLHYNRGRFFVIRDSYGITQILVPRNLVKDIKKLSFESVLKIEGTVTARPSDKVNLNMATGRVEIMMENYALLNSALPNMPFEFRYDVPPTDEVRLRYRYLDLRRENVQRNLRFRSDLVQRMRRFLHERCAFVEVETPTLFRRTPGGAAEFVVPSSDMPGMFYCLPQSPQQYKQLLMVGGTDRYFQIARCYRDEGGRSDRQPEFTQVDLELSFTTQKDVMALIESLIVESWPEEMDQLRPAAPFPVMTYAEAMSRFGTDKPDLRFQMEIIDLSQFGIDSLFCVAAPRMRDDQTVIEQWRHKLHHQHPGTTPFELIQWRRDERGLIEWRSFDGDSSSLIGILDVESEKRLEHFLQLLDCSGGTLICASSTGKNFSAHKTLGLLRLWFADYMESEGIVFRSKNEFAFLWVVDFPLFLSTDEPGQWESAHHPFTAPIPEHVELLKTDPGRCIGQHYDLVLNGVELGGGSIRIHDADLQRYVLETVLREDSSELKHLLDALECGAPPHGGFAIGLDRYLAVLLGASSIRDVIAFPKTQTGRDPLCDAPASPSADQLNRYHIKIIAEQVE